MQKFPTILWVYLFPKVAEIPVKTWFIEKENSSIDQVTRFGKLVIGDGKYSSMAAHDEYN